MQGVNYAAGLSAVIGSIADHRGLTDLYIDGEHSRAQAITTAASAADAAIEAVSNLEKQLDPGLRNGRELAELIKQWGSLKQQAITLPPQENDRRHVALLEQLRTLHAGIVDRSKLPARVARS